MKRTDTAELAVRLLNSTLGLDDLSPEMHGRIATALVLLDRQDKQFINGILKYGVPVFGGLLAIGAALLGVKVYADKK